MKYNKLSNLISFTFHSRSTSSILALLVTVLLTINRL